MVIFNIGAMKKTKTILLSRRRGNEKDTRKK